ncbi:ABC transporter substrate-binding protein [Paenibacillus baekrokdamisoli]|uniref:ABC transporter substrate-binding protein n=1 Tax=Paenibacillus baekrokdamisoli TaxID=1712516 RepID=A0A3G9JNT8_9BACL|nr:ABC transporter substrate-binding protein [Paenibacillus baekrokdamisoli]MBB3072125.1 putative aldouronate transport system substrate-binding protein [Paenibacillus baekrokdamisoli]BBH24709.1 ABC transporter substrate-binding protein [Paenibacillus baekrokdamisoli]
MKRMRKSATLKLILILAMSAVMAACGSNKSVNDSGTKETNTDTKTNAETGKGTNDTTKTDDSASKLKPYVIKITYPSADGSQKDEAAVEAALNKYLTEKINATVDLMPIGWGPWNDKSNLMIAGRDKIDIFFTAQWDRYTQNVAKGAFLPIDDLLKTAGKPIVDYQDPAFLAGSKIDGKNYGVPTTKELASQGGILYRKDIAEELGLDMTKVKTISDLIPILETVKAKKPDMIPLFLRDGENFASHYFSNYDPLGDITVPGVILKNVDDKVVKPIYELDIYKQTLKVTRDMYLKKLINTDAATTQVGSTDAMKAGNVFAIPSPLKPGKAEEVAGSVGLPGKLAQIEMNEKTVSTSETAGSMLAISSTSADPERAMMFIALLHTDPIVNNLMNFGIEGVNYTKVNDHVIKATDKTKDFAPGTNWMFGNQFLNYLWDTEPADKWEQFKAFNQGAHLSTGLGFVFNGDQVKTEVGAIQSVLREFRNPLETGSVDPDKVIPQYAEKLKAAGQDKIIQEKQKQLDEYLAKKG